MKIEDDGSQKWILKEEKPTLGSLFSAFFQPPAPLVQFVNVFKTHLEKTL